jgi:hypothetical protein
LFAAAVAVRARVSATAGDGELAQRHCDEATEYVDQLSDEVLARRLDALSLPGRQETIVAYVIEAGAPGA